jgi:glycosyltransferase involved in cell wall biosynthesis
MVRYTTELLGALSRRDDVDVAAVTTPAAADAVSAIVGSDRVLTIPARPLPMMALRERRADLPAPWPDVDVVHGVKHLLPRHGPALRVLTVHDLLPLDRPHDFGIAKRTLLPGPYRASLREADVLLCVSEATRGRLGAHVASAVDRSTVVPLASAGSLLAATAEAVPELAGRQFAMVVGDASPRKNLRTLVAAWPAVTEQVPGATLAVVGPPNWGRSAAVGWQALHRAGSLVSLRQVADARLRWAYEHATVVLCPSLAEGFGLPVVEALDLHAPIVIAKDPALVEAAAGRAWRELPATDPAAWAAALIDAFRTPAPRPGHGDGPARSWDDVAAESVSAVRHAMAGRTRDGASCGSGRRRR